MNQYIHKKTGDSYVLISKNPALGKVNIRPQHTYGITVTISEETFNKQYEQAQVGPKPPCECGVEKAYGNVPKDWHTDYCPRSN